MKTRILALTLTLVMLLCMVPFSTFAAKPAPIHYNQDAVVDANNVVTSYATPAGAKITNTETGATKAPEIRTPIAAASGATPEEKAQLLADVVALRQKVLSIGLKTSQTVEAPDADANAHKTNGFSIIGVKEYKNADTTAAAGVDGDWIGNSVQFKATGELYNVKGVALKDKAEADNAADYRYANLYTFNFGGKVLVDGIGFIGANCNNMPQSADIYISNDGEKWVLVGYYDRISARANQNLGNDATDYPNQTLIGINEWFGADTEWPSDNKLALMRFMLDKSYTAQYVRIAATTYSGANNGNINVIKEADNTKTPYDPDVGHWKADTNQTYAYEFLVFGSEHGLPQADENGKVTYCAAPIGASIVNGTTLAPEIRTPAAATKETPEVLTKVIGLRQKVLSIGLSTVQTADAPTVDINAHKTTGFTILGVQSFKDANTTAAAGVDGDWISNSVTFSSTGDLYNVSGTTLANKGANDDANDYRYVNLYTYNFGKAKLIEAVGYIGDNCNRMPQSADIYVSNDGETWTLVGWYDRLGARASANLQAGHSDYPNQTIFTIPEWVGADEKWPDSGKAALMYFELPEAQTAQYVRIAATTNSGTNNGNATTEGSGIKYDLYNPYKPGVGTFKSDAMTQITYEFLVFGEAAPATAITELPTVAAPAVGENLPTEVTVAENAGYTAGTITWTDDENNAATAVKAGFTYTGVVTLTIANAEDHFFTTEGLTLADGVTVTVSEDKLTLTMTYVFTAPGEKETEPAETEDSTDDVTTDTPTTDDTPSDDKGGCKSVVGGMSAILLLAGAAVALVAKKKED